MATIDDLVNEVQRLTREVDALAASIKAGPVPVPTPPATVQPVRPVVPSLPPRPGNVPAPPPSNKDTLADLLGVPHPVSPHTDVIPPEVMARYTADQKAYIDAFRSSGPLVAFHMHLQPPNLNEYRINHAYVWPGHAILANAQPGHNPRPL